MNNEREKEEQATIHNNAKRPSQARHGEGNKAAPNQNKEERDNHAQRKKPTDSNVKKKTIIDTKFDVNSFKW